MKFKHFGLWVIAFIGIVGQASAGPMTIPGSFDVTPNGAATYDVPIAVPPGTAGMVPKVSLAYSSAPGNGLVGVGWSLSGLSSITRCPQTIVTEGNGTNNVPSAITYTATDRFCLDGQKLVAVQGTYGANGTIYRTEADNLSQVVSYTGTGVSGPAYFVVTTRAGEIMTYVHTLDSKMTAPVSGQSGVSAIRAWGVNQIADPMGNYLNVTYCPQNSTCTPKTPTNGTGSAVTTAAGEWVPLEIDYTGNNGSNLAPVSSPYNAVTFSYTGRTDVITSYQAGSVITTSNILASVQTYANNALVSTYMLTYALGAATQRSQLQSIQLCGADGTCLPATTFGWEPSGLPSSSTLKYTSLESGGFQLSQADFDGDGKQDFLGYKFINNGTGIYNDKVDIWYGNGDGTFTLGASPPPLPPIYASAISVAALGTDGRSSLFYNDSGSPDWNWSAAFAPTTRTGAWTIMTTAQMFPWWSSMTATEQAFLQYAGPNFGSFKGNGLNDILMTGFSNGVESTQLIYNNSKVANGTFQAPIPVAGMPAYQYYEVYIGDFNGDGKSDLLVVEDVPDDKCGNYTGRMSVGLSNGDGTFTWTTLPNQGAGYHPLIGDFNGDGKTDILLEGTTCNELQESFFWSVTSGSWILLTSKGDGSFIANTTPFGAGSIYPGYTPFVADFNGDGVSDVLLDQENYLGVSSGLSAILLSQGGGTWAVNTTFLAASHEYMVPFVGTYDGSGQAGIMWDEPLCADGSIDQCANIPNYNTYTMALPIGFQWDLMNQITTGLGANDTITYQTLSQVGTAYTPTTSVAAYPNQNVLGGAQPIVTQVATSNGLSVTTGNGTGVTPGLELTNYAYASGLTGLTGRGFLGFGSVTAAKTSNAATPSPLPITTVTYVQAYPWVGSIAEKTVVVGSGSNAVTVTDTVNTYSSIGDATLTAIPAFSSPNSNTTHKFPYLSQTVSSGSDLDGSSLPTVTITNSTPDAYGNSATVTKQTVAPATAQTPAQTFTSKTTNTWQPDTANWCLAELTDSVVKSTVATTTTSGTTSTSQTRETAASYGGQNSTAYPNYPCLVMQSIIEPSYTTSGNHIYSETDYAYDNFGNKNSIQVKGYDNGSSLSVMRKATTTWDSLGQFPKSTVVTTGDPTGGVATLETDYTHDPRFGGVATMTDPNGTASHASNAAYHKTTTTYDSLGRAQQVTHPEGNYDVTSYALCSGVAGGGTTCTANSNGTAPAYVVTHTSYGTDGQTLVSPTTKAYVDFLDRGSIDTVRRLDNTVWTNVYHTFDDAGRALAVSEPTSTTPSAWTTNVYDALSRVTLTTGPDGETTKHQFDGLASTTWNADNQSRITYLDGLSRTVAVTDSLGRTSTSVYDPFGDLLSVTDPAGNVVTYAYDQRGHMTGMTDPDRGTPANPSWAYTYDSLGQLLNQTSPQEAQAGVGATTYTYDLMGRMTQRVDPAGDVAGMTSTWTYDAATNGLGLLYQATTNLGYVRTQAYDSYSRAASTALTPDTNNFTFTKSYTYDPTTGRLATETNPDGAVLSTVYNAAGYPSGRTMTVAGTTTNVSTITGVDDSNRPLTVVSGGVPGSSTSYDSLTTRTFDAEGRPQTIGVTGSHGGALMSMSLQFDPAENLTSRTYQNQNVAAWTESFTYDGLSRLCTALESTATSTAGPTTVGPTKPCPTQPSGFGGASYTYDSKVARLATKSDVGTYAYTANGPHQMSAVTPSASAIYSYPAGPAYNADGAMTSGGSRTYQWTSFDMPGSIAVTGSQADTAALTYGPEHQRVILTDSYTNATTYYIDLGTDRVEAKITTGTSTTGEWHDYASLPGTPTAEVRTVNATTGSTTTWMYLHTDHLGSVILVTGPTNPENDGYDAWGRRRYPTGVPDPATLLQSVTDLGFTGQEDPGIKAPPALSGLVFLGDRMYDSSIGLFSSADRTGKAGGPNPFAYANHNPLKFVDPSGHSPVVYNELAQTAHPYYSGRPYRVYNPAGFRPSHSGGGGADFGATDCTFGCDSSPEFDGGDYGNDDSSAPSSTSAEANDASHSDSNAQTNEATTQTNNTGTQGVSPPPPPGVQGADKPADKPSTERADGHIWSDSCTVCAGPGKQVAAVDEGGEGGSIGGIGGARARVGVGKLDKPEWMEPDGPAADVTPGGVPIPKEGVNWPDNDGFDGMPKRVLLPQGTRIDRYGNEYGKFLAPAGTPFEQRSLPESYLTDGTHDLHTYEVTGQVWVRAGRSAPWFGQPGGGIQYQTGAPVALLKAWGALTEITPKQ